MYSLTKGMLASVELTRDEQAAQTERFRGWLGDQIEHHPMSLNSIEVSAGIRGNALGKFLRGERGSRHSLTPLMIRRLAPVLNVDEETLLSRAGHMTREPGSLAIESAIMADQTLSDEDKRFLTDVYRRAVTRQ